MGRGEGGQGGLEGETRAEGKGGGEGEEQRDEWGRGNKQCRCWHNSACMEQDKATEGYNMGCMCRLPSFAAACSCKEIVQMGDRLLAVEHCSTAGTRRHRTAELRGSPAPWLRGLAGLPPQAAAAAEPAAAQPAPAPAPAE